MSRGSIRAVNIASRLGQKIRGTIILSGSTDDTHDGTMFDPPIKEANSSFLMIWPKNNKCLSSENYDGLENFVVELKGVNDKTIGQWRGELPQGAKVVVLGTVLDPIMDFMGFTEKF